MEQTGTANDVFAILPQIIILECENNLLATLLNYKLMEVDLLKVSAVCKTQ